MKISITSAALLSLWIVVPASAADPIDPLCAPMKAFAASVMSNLSRERVFRTVWGSNFRGGDKPAMFAKSCEHRSYGPAAVTTSVAIE
jgi:hypothetical protein